MTGSENVCSSKDIMNEGMNNPIFSQCVKDFKCGTFDTAQYESMPLVTHPMIRDLFQSFQSKSFQGSPDVNSPNNKSTTV
ncbi:MAG: hypothetical protein WC774_00375 [Candidatus Gracilibacteria bacterium]